MYFHEGYEVFGFESKKIPIEKYVNRSPNAPIIDKCGDLPVCRFNLERLNSTLLKHSFGPKSAIDKMFDVIQWGEGVGAVRVRYSTKFDAIIERATADLQGDVIWVAKSMLNINTKYFSGQEEIIAYEIIDEVERVNKSLIDSPSGKIEDFEYLTKRIAESSSAVVNDPLFYESTNRLGKNYFAIQFGVKGHGLQAKDQKRVEQVLINLVFNEDKGILNASQQTIKSNLGQHNWDVMPQDLHFRFMPNQNENEIINILSIAMKYF